MRLFVTGASGFIGRRLCLVLKAKGDYIVGLDRSPAVGDCDEGVLGDLTAVGPWEKALEGTDTVYHLAGKVHALSEAKQDDAEYFRVNTEATRNLLGAAQRAGVRRFIFFSTVKAMSREEAESGTAARFMPGVGPLSETDLIQPDTPYGRSKLEAEKLVLHGGYVSEPVVLRLCLVYGAGAKGNMQNMLWAVSRNQFPPLPEVGNRRSMVHVQDVIQAALLAREKPQAVGEIFIVSDGRPYSTRQIYEWMCQALNRPCPRWTVPLWVMRGLGLTGDLIGRLRGRRFLFDSDALTKLIGSAWFSSQKIEAMLGFHPAWDLEKAMPEMVDEMRQRQISGAG